MGECGGGVSTRKYNLQNLYSALKSGPVCSITDKGRGLDRALRGVVRGTILSGG